MFSVSLLAVIFGGLLVVEEPAAETPAAAPATRWPGFRGVGTGWTEAWGLPLKWNKASWSVELEGYGQSAPAVWDDRAFVTSVVGPKKDELVVFCVALSQGEMLWSRRFATSTLITSSDEVSRAAPTPAVDGERVVAFFESGDLVCLDHEGIEIWRKNLAERFGPFQGDHGMASSPLLADGKVYVLLDHGGPSHLVALDAASGESLWAVEREPRISWATPVIGALGQGVELVVSSNGTVDGYSLDEGKRLWQVDGIEGNTIPSPTIVGQQVVVGRSKAAGLVLVERPAEGAAELLWSGDSLPRSGYGSPLVQGEVICLVNRAGVLTTVERASGEPRGAELRLVCGELWASPVTDGVHSWFFGKKGVTSVVSWTDKGAVEAVTNELPVEGGVHGVAAVNGTFLIRGPSRLYCVSGPKPAATGKPPSDS